MRSFPVRCCLELLLDSGVHLSLCFVSAGTSVLWWLYIDHRLSANDTSAKTKTDSREEAEFGRDGRQTLLVYAVAATVFTVGQCPVRSTAGRRFLLLSPAVACR